MFAIGERPKMKTRRGRPVINLLDEIKRDVNLRGFKFETLEDIVKLREVATNLIFWNNIGKKKNHNDTG